MNDIAVPGKGNLDNGTRFGGFDLTLSKNWMFFLRVEFNQKDQFSSMCYFSIYQSFNTKKDVLNLETIVFNCVGGL